ncbi:MAG: BatD family protein [Phyllobacterium sp.]
MPNFFLSPPQFPVFDLPNAIVALSDANAQNLVETIDGQSYSGIRHAYIITPQIAGDFTIPAAAITFAYAAVPGQSTNGSVNLPALTFSVGALPDAAGGKKVAAANTLAIAQKLGHDPKTLKVGDALDRVITITAEGMQSMMIPAPEFEGQDGIRIYPHDPVLRDSTDGRSGATVGTRIDRVTYAFDKPGDYILSAVEIAWYDPVTQKTETVKTEKVTVTVAPTEAFKPAIAPPVAPAEKSTLMSRTQVRYLLLGTVLLSVLFALAWIVHRVWPRFRARRAERRDRKEHSEPAYFQNVERSCRQQDRTAVYAALDAWFRSSGLSGAHWVSEFGDGNLQSQYKRLEQEIFVMNEAGEAVDLGKLGAGFKLARKNWLNARDSKQTDGSALPALNP